MEAEERKHKGRLDLCMLAIWWNEAVLEHAARKHLKVLPPEDLEIQGTEYRMTNLDEIIKATNIAREQL